MKNLITATIVFLVSLVSVFVFAGNEKGNGGHTVICTDSQGKIKKQRLYDYYEGETLGGFTFYFNKNISGEDFLAEFFNRLEQLDPHRFNGALEEALNIYTAMQEHKASSQQRIRNLFFTPHPLEYSGDTGNIYDPYKGLNCEKEQFVIYSKVKTHPDDPDYRVNSKILKRLSEQDLRGIAIHEVLYQVFYEQLDSAKVRYLHQTLMSVAPEDITLGMYLSVVRKMTHYYISPYLYNEKKPSQIGSRLWDIEVEEPLTNKNIWSLQAYSSAPEQITPLASGGAIFGHLRYYGPSSTPGTTGYSYWTKLLVDKDGQLDYLKTLEKGSVEFNSRLTLTVNSINKKSWKKCHEAILEQSISVDAPGAIGPAQLTESIQLDRFLLNSSHGQYHIGLTENVGYRFGDIDFNVNLPALPKACDKSIKNGMSLELSLSRYNNGSAKKVVQIQKAQPTNIDLKISILPNAKDGSTLLKKMETLY